MAQGCQRRLDMARGGPGLPETAGDGWRRPETAGDGRRLESGNRNHRVHDVLQPPYRRRAGGISDLVSTST